MTTYPAPTAVGIDVGTSNTRAVLVEWDRPRMLAAAGSATPDDAAALTALVSRLVAEVTGGAPEPPRAVGVASMAETGVPLDAGDTPLCELLRWNARQDHSDAAALADELGGDALFAATGVRPGPKAPLATWRWLRRERPGVWSAMARWAGAADLVCLALTGHLVTDHTLAGRTMAYRLPEPGREPPAGFDPDLLAAVGLRTGQLPAVARPGAVAATVRADVASATGLAAGTPVVIAGHDHQVGAWAAGLRGPGTVVDSLGTTEALVRVLSRPADRAAVAAAGMSLVRTVDGRHEALVAGSPSAGALLRRWLDTGASLDDAAALPDRPTGCLVLPYPSGRQSPAPDPHAPVRLPPPGTEPATATRAVVEGLALQARWMYEVQCRLAGSPAAEMVVLAGAAHDLWPRVKAAVLPVPVRVVRIAEPVATGAALLAAHRAGPLADPPAPVASPTGSPPTTGQASRAGDDGPPVLPSVRVGAPDPAYDAVFRSFVTLAGDP